MSQFESDHVFAGDCSIFPPRVYSPPLMTWGSLFPIVRVAHEVHKQRSELGYNHVGGSYRDAHGYLPECWTPPPLTPDPSIEGVMYRYLVGQYYTYHNACPRLTLQYVICIQEEGMQYLWNQEVTQSRSCVRNQLIARIAREAKHGVHTSVTTAGNQIPATVKRYMTDTYLEGFPDDVSSDVSDLLDIDDVWQDQSAGIEDEHVMRGLLASLLHGLAYEVHDQTPPVNVPEGYQGLFSSLTSLFTSKTITASDPVLSTYVDESHRFFDGEEHTFVTGFRWCIDNWRIAKSAPLFKHVRNMLGIAIATGFLPEEYGEWHVKNVMLFQAEYNGWDNAASMIDATVEAVGYFIEAVVASWDRGTLEPWLHERTLARKFDEAYEYVVRTRNQIETGAFSKAGSSWSDMIYKVRMAHQLYELALNNATPGSATRHFIKLRLDEIRSIENGIWARRKGGELVEQPPVIIYYGEPGVGKSLIMNLTLQMMHHISAPDVPWEESLVASVNPDDAFDSTIGNDTMYFQVNDVANRPIKYDPSMGVAKILQMADNVQFTATKAEVELKGKVNPTFNGGVGSTNNETLNIQYITVCPGSIMRRIWRCDMTIIPEYDNGKGGVDTEKVEYDRERGLLPVFKIGDSIIDDIWTFTLNVGGVEDTYVPMEWALSPGRPKEPIANMPLHQYLYYLQSVLTNHYTRQKKHLAKMKNTRIANCSKCQKLFCECGSQQWYANGMLMYPCGASQCDDSDSCGDDMTCREVEVQGLTDYLTDALWNVSPLPINRYVGKSVTNAVFSSIYSRITTSLQTRLGLFSAYWTMLPSRAQALTTTYVTKACWDLIDQDPSTQWWYWIPDAMWGHWTTRTAATFLLDSELYRRLESHKWNVRFYGVGLFSSIVYAKWGWYFPVDIPMIGSAARSVVGANFVSLFTPLLNRIGTVQLPDTQINTGHINLAFMCLCSLGVSYNIWRQGQLVKHAYHYLSRKRGTMSQAAKNFRDTNSPYIKMLMNGLGVISAAFVAYRSFEWCCDMLEIRRGHVSEDKVIPVIQSENLQLKDKISTPTEQQNFLGMSDEDLRKKNEKTSEWYNMTVTKLSRFRNPNMTTEQLVGKVEKNLSTCHVWKDGAWIYSCNILWICTHHALVPRHIMPRTRQRWRITDNHAATSHRYVTVEASNFTACKDGDIAFLHLEHRHKANLTPYFSNDPDIMRARYLLRDSVSSLATTYGPYSGEFTTVRGENARYIGWMWDRDTFVGACGGVYISEGKNPAILGIHVKGGTQVRTWACSLGVSSDMITTYLREHREANPSYISGSEEPEIWESRANNTSLFDTGCPHGIVDSIEYLSSNEKAVEKQGAVAIGHRNIGAFYKSRAVDTLIAQYVAEKSDKSYGKPRFGRSMFPKSARYTFDSTPGLPESHLRWAYHDYMSAFKDMPKYLLEHLRPLSWHEVANGIRGVRFIDPMNFSTAMGLGYGGTKSDWFPQATDENGNLYYQLNPAIVAEAEETINQLERGVRVGWLFNAVPKDEPTPTTKDKVRIFMVALIACTMVVRKYYTPVCRILQMMTQLSECAVGMNPMSRDWDAMVEFLLRFSSYFDGDFEKYDLRKNARLSSVSYKIMIDIAAMGDYTPRELYLMEMIANELLRPLVNYNGEVYLLDGSTPSGIPVTVIVNSLDNSILNRCAFVSAYPHSRIGDFRRYVSLITYGDDFVNAVSWWRNDFNFLTMQKYLREFDFVLTPGVKTAEPRKWLNGLSDVVFLQRRTSVIPGIPFRVGKLNEQSILKSLMCVLESPHLTLAQATAINVDGAMREYVLYDKLTYEHRQKWLRDICCKASIAHLCSDLHTPYEVMLTRVIELQP